MHSHDFLFGLRCSCILANLAHVFLHSLLHDNEAANHAHVQAQVCTDQFWKVKIQKRGTGEGNVRRRYAQRKVGRLVTNFDRQGMIMARSSDLA